MLRDMGGTSGGLQLRLLLWSSLGLGLMAGWLSGSPADVFLCDHRDQAMHALVTESMNVCCQLREVPCSSSSGMEQWTIKPDPDCQACWDNITRPDNCTVRMEGFKLDPVTMNKSGNLVCTNGKLSVSEHYAFIEPPAMPSKIDVVFTVTKNITVVFDRGEPDLAWTDAYTVTMTENGRNYTLCSKEICGIGQRWCKCQYNGSEDLLNPTNVTIIVSVTRSVVPAVVAQSVFTVMKHVRPSPVTKLNVQPNATEALVRFSNYDPMISILRFMCLEGNPLIIHVRVVRTQGVPEETKFEMTLPGDGERNGAMAVILPALTPYTNYTVVVWGSAGGREGYKTSLEFTTAKSVPTEPPEMDSSNFIVTVNSTGDDGHMFNLELMWQALPQGARGGANVTYVVEVVDDVGTAQFSSETAQTWILFTAQEPPDGPLTAKVWARNEVGLSTHFSEIRILPKYDTVKPQVQVEFVGERANVFLHLPEGEKPTSLAIHHCMGYKSYKDQEMDICQNPPTTQILSSSQAVSMNPILLSLGESTDPPMKNESRNISYYILRCLNHSLAGVEPHIAVASVLIYPPLSEQDVADYGDEEDLHTSYYYYDECRNTRSRREAEGQPDLLYSRIFVSVKSEGSWQGMVPANCYFDKSLDAIDVTPWIEDEKDNPDSFLLYWKQMCSSAKPKSFLADYYEAYTSEDDDCKNAVTPVEVVDNQLFQQMQIKLHRSAKFACVRAYRNQSDVYMSFPKAIDPPPGTPGNKDTNTAALASGIAGAVAFVIFAILFILTFRYCRRKSRQFDQLVAKVEKVEMDTSQEEKESESSPPPPLPPPRQVSETTGFQKTENGCSNTTDSGRVSDFISGSNSGALEEGVVGLSSSGRSKKWEEICEEGSNVPAHCQVGFSGREGSSSGGPHLFQPLPDSGVEGIDINTGHNDEWSSEGVEQQKEGTKAGIFFNFGKASSGRSGDMDSSQEQDSDSDSDSGSRSDGDSSETTGKDNPAVDLSAEGHSCHNEIWPGSRCQQHNRDLNKLKDCVIPMPNAGPSLTHSVQCPLPPDLSPPSPSSLVLSQDDSSPSDSTTLLITTSTFT